VLGKDQLVVAVGAAAGVKKPSLKAGTEGAQRIAL
jgi:hypothetical protein